MFIKIFKICHEIDPNKTYTGDKHFDVKNGTSHFHGVTVITHIEENVSFLDY